MTRPMSEAVEAARRIVAWDDAGRLADDEWLVERNESAIIAIARALLSTSASERGLREALVDLIEGVREVRVEGATIVLVCSSRLDAQGRILNARAALSPPKDTTNA